LPGKRQRDELSGCIKDLLADYEPVAYLLPESNFRARCTNRLPRMGSPLDVFAVFVGGRQGVGWGDK
jgi:hypothetical protein